MIVRLALCLALVLTGTGAVPTTSTVTTTGARAPDGNGAVVAAADTAPQGGAAEPVTVTEVDVVVPAVDATGAVVDSAEVQEAQADPGVLVADEVATVVPGASRVVSDVLENDGFQTLGVTWPAGLEVGQLGTQVRTRADGEWSAWQKLDVADDAPDVGSADAGRGARDGTDPLWVGEADAVQISFTADATAGPADLSLALVDIPEPTAPAGAVGAVASAAADVQSAVHLTAGVPTALSPPVVISREQWGARAQACTPDVAATLVGAVVHHTAGPNTYSTVTQAMQQIRGDQAYHMSARGWCDLGYNFVVDKWGNIYEGRANSLGQAVIGVHAGGFNTGTVGVSMLGTYDVAPSAATVQAVGQIIGWRLGAYGVDPHGSMSYTTGDGDNSRFKNQTVTLPRVIGHRDVAFTACPGNGGVAVLPAMRSVAAGVATAVEYADAVVRVDALYQDMLGRTPDVAGRAFWADRLITLGGPGTVANGLAMSPEYVTTRVVQAYTEILGRAPDAVGLDTWTAEISSGRLRQEDLRGQLIASDEYFGLAGGTLPGYIALLYGDILGRAAAPGEIEFWVDQVARRGRAAAPSGIWYSLESAARRVNETYAVYLDRTSDPEGLRTWPSYWIANGENALRAGVVGSTEYLLRARTRHG